MAQNMHAQPFFSKNVLKEVFRMPTAVLEEFTVIYLP